MTHRFYIGLLVAALALIMIVVVAPRLRLRSREIKRRKLEHWYEQGPRLAPGMDPEKEPTICTFCGNPTLKKEFIGSYERADLLRRRFNHISVDEARFYEYRCARCNSLSLKERLSVPTPDST